jgi:hypothetical protein
MPMSERLKEREIHDGTTCRAGSAVRRPRDIMGTELFVDGGFAQV